MKKGRKRFFYVLALIFLTFFGWRLSLLIRKGAGAKSSQYGRPPVAVEVRKATYSSIRDIRRYTGTVYPYYRYIVAPKVTGRIIEMRKRIGDWVKRGEIIARVDDAEYQQAVYEAEANLKIAQASLNESSSQYDLSKQEYERVQSLHEKGIASSSELDAAVTQFNAQKSRLNLAKAQVEQREASLKSAKIRFGYTVLAAAEPGFIGERFVDEGALLAPNTPVVSVIGIDTVFVRTTIIERDYGRVHVGQDAEITVDTFPGKTFLGRVSRLAPMLDEASRVANMEIVVANDSLFLKPGMFTQVSVILSEKDSAQVVPSGAVVRRNGTEGVFIVGSGGKTASFVPIQQGIITEDLIEVAEPRLDSPVITLGHHLLENGSPILLPGAGGNDSQKHPGGRDSRASGTGRAPGSEKGGSGKGPNR